MFSGQNGKKLLVGYDLTDSTSQISYCEEGDNDISTLAVVMGTENYNIPTVLCKRKEVGQWFYGKEALKYAEEEDGLLLTNLLSLARSGDSVEIEGEMYSGIALLTLFVKRSLGLFSMIASLDRIVSITFTCEEMDEKLIDALERVCGGLGLKTKQFYFQSHTESFYYYTLHQSPDLWNHQVMVCDFHVDFLKIYRLEMNHRTTPIVTFIDRTEFRNFPVDFPTGEEAVLPALEKEKDHKFHMLLEQVMDGRIFSSVYLIGDGFKNDWMKESLKYLCKNRRVFQGNNLYSKGACYGLLEKGNPSAAGKSHVFLGDEKLKANIGMKVLRKGMDSYFALLDAGVNWYEAKNECEVYLDKGNVLSFIVTPLNGKEIKIVQVVLDGLAERPEKCTRLRVTIQMKGQDMVVIQILDLGLGEIFPSTGQQWNEEFYLDSKEV